MLELMAKGGMRIGEVLKLRPVDVKDRKITLPDPKSGKESEIVFIPQKIADRLREYIRDMGIESEDRIFLELFSGLKFYGAACFDFY
jgi:integrase